MSPELQSIIKQYNALPEAVQQTIFYGEVGKIVGEIGRAFGLDANKATALENEVTLILLFLVPRESFESTLTSSFSMPPADAKTVAFLIDNAILVPTFKRLERAFAAPVPPVAAPTQATPAPSPAPAPTVTPSASTLPEVRTMAGDQKQLGYQEDDTIDTPSYTGLSQDELTKRN